jgi:hypothetical protein
MAQTAQYFAKMHHIKPSIYVALNKTNFNGPERKNYVRTSTVSFRKTNYLDNGLTELHVVSGKKNGSS